jgi:hypothetical protein
VHASLPPTPLHTTSQGVSTHIKLKAAGELQDSGKREVYFEANGVPRVVEVVDKKSMEVLGTTIREKVRDCTRQDKSFFSKPGTHTNMHQSCLRLFTHAVIIFSHVCPLACLVSSGSWCCPNQARRLSAWLGTQGCTHTPHQLYIHTLVLHLCASHCVHL